MEYFEIVLKFFRVLLELYLIFALFKLASFLSKVTVDFIKMKLSKEEINYKFKIGDRVCLKSGSENMTVVNTSKYANEVICAYFNKDGEVFEATYHVNALV